MNVVSQTRAAGRYLLAGQEGPDFAASGCDDANDAGQHQHPEVARQREHEAREQFEQRACQKTHAADEPRCTVCGSVQQSYR